MVVVLNDAGVVHRVCDELGALGLCDLPDQPLAHFKCLGLEDGF